MKSRIFLLAVFIAGAAAASDRWTSPDNFYSIVPPTGWKYSKFTGPQDPSGTSHAFTSPDKNSEVRISATYNLDYLPEILPEDALQDGFPKEHGVTPIQRIRGKGWDGIRREYINDDRSKHWLAIVARHDNTLVFLTMMAPEKEFERYRATFEAVGKSLELGQQTSSKQTLRPPRSATRLAAQD